MCCSVLLAQVSARNGEEKSSWANWSQAARSHRVWGVHSSEKAFHWREKYWTLSWGTRGVTLWCSCCLVFVFWTLPQCTRNKAPLRHEYTADSLLTLLWVEGWIRWPLIVPSNLNYSMTLSTFFFFPQSLEHFSAFLTSHTNVIKTGNFQGWFIECPGRHSYSNRNKIMLDIKHAS